MGAKTTPRMPKLGYFDGRVPKVSSRVALATASGAGVVCHIFCGIHTIWDEYAQLAYNWIAMIKRIEEISQIKMFNPNFKKKSYYLHFKPILSVLQRHTTRIFMLKVHVSHI